MFPSKSFRSHRSFVAVLLLAMAVLAAVGCQQPFDHYTCSLQAPLSPAMTPPREIEKVSLPAYVVEPPDILSVEMLKMIPLPPYRIDVYDVLQIRASFTIQDQPIDNFYIVEAEGVVNLGPAYGSVRVVGMTIEEATDAMRRKLAEVLRQPEVSVQLARTAGTQPVTGQYLVGPDGTINLRTYGVVHVAGKTMTEIKIALQQHLAHYFDSPEVSIDVLGYNSKVYYVITDGAGMGDNVRRIPVTGNETVLDAISAVGGLSQLSSKEVWVARPAPGNFGCETDPAGRLRGDHPRRCDGHELSDHARRSGVHRRRQFGGLQQRDRQVHRPHRAPAGHLLARLLDGPRLPNLGSRLQSTTLGILVS